MPYSRLGSMSIRSNPYSPCRVMIKVGYSLIRNNQIGHQRQVCNVGQPGAIASNCIRNISRMIKSINIDSWHHWCTSGTRRIRSSTRPCYSCSHAQNPHSPTMRCVERHVRIAPHLSKALRTPQCTQTPNCCKCPGSCITMFYSCSGGFVSVCCNCPGSCISMWYNCSGIFLKVFYSCFGSRILMYLVLYSCPDTCISMCYSCSCSFVLLRVSVLQLLWQLHLARCITACQPQPCFDTTAWYIGGPNLSC